MLGPEDESAQRRFHRRGARANGLIVLPAGDNVVRLLPPLTLSEAEAREGVELLNKTAAADGSAEGGRPMNAPLKNKPRHFLDLSDHDSATLKAHHRRRQAAQAGARAACPRACPTPTSR